MKLSIITVNYNDAAGLERTIKSVISQTFHDFEFIVIDGGSTDGSVDVIKRYANNIDYWVSEPDGGIYQGMNKGLRQAKGEYVNFMNGGDCFHSPNVLETIFFNNTEADIITGDHEGSTHPCIGQRILVEYLEHEGYEIIDLGTDTTDSVDFPEYAFKLGDSIIKKKVNKGIAICGTGIGMSIALNKVKGVYCAKVSNINEAVLCRQHNDANVIAISADLDEDLAKEIADKFLEIEFLGDAKYKRRNKMIKDRENG